VVPFELEGEESKVVNGDVGRGAYLGGQEQEWSLWNQICHPHQFAKAKEASREKDRKWKRHLEVCSSCREGDAGIHDQQQSSDSSKSVIGKDDDVEEKDEGEWMADISISGMTCTACVSNVQKAAETVKGVEDIQVNLMTSSARLMVKGQSTIDVAVEAINDAGYDADVISKQRSGQVQKKAQIWRATFSVGGMTCASCISNVEKAVKASDDNLESFTVALMQSSAMASFSAAHQDGAQKRAEAVCESIEDSGYDCALEELRPEGEEGDGANLQRTVRIRVDGMFCSHCTSKLQHYLRESNHIDVKEGDLAAFTLASPSITLTYTPSPQTTIRSILAHIEALDVEFQAQIVIPPSISSRSAIHARKELYALLIRLIFAFLFVPPTLLIAVIVPTFLSESHPLRISLSNQIVGQASKGDIILWALATPVQFGVGHVFYQRAFKSLRSVWRSGRSWQDRIISWGDMNVLVALGTSVAYFASLAFLVVDMTREPMMEAMEGSMTYFDACVFLICEFLFLETITKLC